MDSSKNDSSGSPEHLRLHPKLMVRQINELIEKIQKDKTLKQVPGRESLIARIIHTHLSETCFQNDWVETAFEETRLGKDPREETQLKRNNSSEDLRPLSVKELNAALDAIPGLSVVEKVMFIEDLHFLDRTAQQEFLALLKTPKSNS